MRVGGGFWSSFERCGLPGGDGVEYKKRRCMMGGLPASECPPPSPPTPRSTAWRNFSRARTRTQFWHKGGDKGGGPDNGGVGPHGSFVCGAWVCAAAASTTQCPFPQVMMANVPHTPHQCHQQSIMSSHTIHRDTPQYAQHTYKTS